MPLANEIVILGGGRSGSNLLCSILERLSGNASYFEIFKADQLPVPGSYGEVIRLLGEHCGLAGSDLNSPEMLSARDADPPAFFAALAAATSAAGYASMSCKIFSHQIAQDTLDRLLERPGLSVIFLTRSRINRHISGLKDAISNVYAGMNPTEVRPALDTRLFLQSSFDHDLALGDMYQRVAASGVKFTVLNYERDLDLAPEIRVERISAALGRIGKPAEFPGNAARDWYVKQDHGLNWRDKIENGFETAAALAGLGLLDYAEEPPLMHALTGRAAPSTATWASLPVEPRDEGLLDLYSNYAVISVDPVITVSAIDNDRSRFAEWTAGPEPVFGMRPGLHFLMPTWSMETSPLDRLVGSLRRAEDRNPGHKFVMLHVSRREADRYRKIGQASIACSPAIFTDEANFAADGEPHPKLMTSDALSIAQFAPWKNHHLAAGLHDPLFVYAKPASEQSKACMAEIAKLCPSAQFANHRIGDGEYRYLGRPELNMVMARARVGLALSNVEGV
ncbi:MAG: hypothetical protein ACRCUE_01930, partial [Bosea sp. (in: a-proteobacteria)]